MKSNKEQQLWNAIKAFSPDEPEAILSFSQRLKRENGWTADYTERAIGEYKRFLFLCCVSSTNLTPSPVVDQVWHLHMVYTQSYWNDLCRTILKRELHHNPTQGGGSEARKYRECYEQTLQEYHLKFGKDAPPDIWPDVKTRFSEGNVRWVDLDTYLLLPRRQTFLLMKASIVIVMVGIIFAMTQWYLSSTWVLAIVGLMVGLWLINKSEKPDARATAGGGCGGGCSDIGSTDTDSGCSSDGGCSSGCSGSGCGGGCSGCS